MIKTAVYCCRAMTTFGKRIATVLDAPLYVDAPVGTVDTVYIIGMFDPPGYEKTLDDTKLARRRVIHWCGTDVLFLEYLSALPFALHLCESENLQRELFDKGVDATVCTFPTNHHFKEHKFPEKKAIAFYYGTDADKYGGSVVNAVMECLGDDWSLNSYGLGQYDERSMDGLIKHSTLYLRLTAHDGSMNSAREFLEAGRHAVVSGELYGSDRVRKDDILQIVNTIQKIGKNPQLDAKVIEHYKHFNSKERYLEDLKGAGFFE